MHRAACIFLIKRTSHQLEVEETENNVEDVQPAEVHPEKDEVSKQAVEMPEQQGVCRTCVDLVDLRSEKLYIHPTNERKLISQGLNHDCGKSNHLRFHPLIKKSLVL